jgi:hypothetical protein
MKSCFYESIPTTIRRSIDLFYSVMNNIEVTEFYHKAVAERQELHSEVVNVDSERSLDDRQLNQQTGVRRRRKFKKRTQGNGASRNELIAIRTRVIRRALPAVRKGRRRKRPGSESTARRIPQRRMCPEFNMGRDSRVARKQLQPKVEGTSDKIIRKLIEIKDKDLKEQGNSGRCPVDSHLGHFCSTKKRNGIFRSTLNHIAYRPSNVKISVLFPP